MQYELNLNFVKGLAVIIPKSDIRYYLKGLYIEASKGEGVFMVSTDGHRLAMIKDDGFQSDGNYSFIIPLETITQLVKVMDKNNPIALLSYNQIDNVIVIEYDNKRFLSSPIDGKFPDFRRIVPAEVSGEAGQYNADYISDFKKMANAINQTKNLECFIKQNGEQVAIVDICAHKPEHNIYGMGLLMPLRKPDSVFDSYSRPLWVDPKKVELRAVA